MAFFGGLPRVTIESVSANRIAKTSIYRRCSIRHRCNGCVALRISPKIAFPHSEDLRKASDCNAGARQGFSRPGGTMIKLSWERLSSIRTWPMPFAGIGCFHAGGSHEAIQAAIDSGCCVRTSISSKRLMPIWRPVLPSADGLSPLSNSYMEGYSHTS